MNIPSLLSTLSVNIALDTNKNKNASISSAKTELLIDYFCSSSAPMSSHPECHRRRLLLVGGTGVLSLHHILLTSLLVLFGTMPVLSYLASNTRNSVTSKMYTRHGSVLLFSSAIDPDTNERAQKTLELQKATKLSLAPMMEYTDRHFRYLVRLISSQTLLYTEMVAANSIAHERKDVMEQYCSDNQLNIDDPSNVERIKSEYNDHFLKRYLGQASAKFGGEGPCALQFGGSNPDHLYEAAQAVMELTERNHCDYTAINLNCGCPSPKVAGKGCFGAALMDEPSLVAELTSAIHHGVGGRLPVTVKCRIGTDSHETYNKDAYANMDPEVEYGRLCQFIETVAKGGIVTDFQVHARIAVLSKSFSPADNRKVPPLKYDLVRRLVNDYPEFTFSLNGGIKSITEALAEFEQSPRLAGVMVGRAWASSPWDFAMADRLLYGDESTPLNRLQILEAYGKHADYEESIGDPVKIRRFIVKAVTPLFAGEPRAKRYRIALDEVGGSAKEMHLKGINPKSGPPLSELIMDVATKYLSEETLLRTPEESYERLLYEESKTTATMP